MSEINFSVITLFPEMFCAFSEYGVTGRALQKNLISLSLYNPRSFTTDSYQTIDDRPFGGGPGMLMKYEPLAKAVTQAKAVMQAESGLMDGKGPKVIYLSPQGQPLTQEVAVNLVKEKSLIFVCGRYEGVDERFIEEYVDQEISIGDFVLSGGELPAMTVMDAVSRLVPNVLGSAESAVEDSFYSGLLDCPHYTRPAVLDSGLKVPDILLSGHHANIAEWRLQQRLGRTQERRPDLLSRQCLSEKNKTLLDDYTQKKSGK
jgi:tRNA (guanine37-N1)-methyltransferase